jgi:PAS domain S-box-containing protein
MFSILYVDDEPGLLEIGKLFLEQGGRFSVETLTSAQEALGILRSRHFDAIISDYQMPVIDGIEFLKRVRASGNTVPFIIFTGRGREEIVIQALNEGADFYLQKGGEPVSQFTELSHKIRQAVQQRRAEASIRDHERREADIINFLPDATFAIDTQGVVIAWNRAMEKMTGVRASETLGKGDYVYAVPFYHEHRPILIDLVLSDDPAIDARYPYVKRDGKNLFSEITIPHFNEGRGAALWFTASPLYDNEGNIIGAIESIREITEWKRTEDALNESERRFRELADMLPLAIYEADGKGILTYANRIAFELFGYTEEILRNGERAMNMIAPEDRKRAAVALSQLNASGTPRQESIEYMALRKDGTKFPVSIYSSPVVRDGKSSGVRGIVIDITERKRTEDTIRTSEQKYRTVFETTGTATVLIENDGTISLANSEFERLSGYPKDEIENRKKWTEFVIQEDLDRMLAQHRMRRQDQKIALTHYEFRFRSRSGEVRDIYLTIDVIPGTTKSVASLLDISERKKVESSLIAANQEYTNLLDQIQDVYYRSDPDGRLVKASRSWATLFGYDDISECIGKSIADDFYVTPADRNLFLEQIYRDGKVTNYEVLLKKKDGTPVLVSTSSHLNVDTAGNVLSIEGTFRNITERKRQERILRTQRDLGIALQTAHAMNETLDICLDAAIEISGLDAGGIYLVDEGSGSLDLVISRNLGTDFVNSVSHYPAGSANGQIVMAGKPIYTQYSESGLIHTSIQEQEGLRASAIIPIAFKNRVIACLNIASHTIDDIPANARIALETIATQIGTAVERIRADDALGESEQRYRNIIEDQTEFICRFRPDGTHVFVNEAYCRYFGLKREELIGHRFRPEIPPEDRERIKRFFSSLTPDHPVDTIEHEIIMPDGRICWQRWSDRAIFDPAGKITEYQSVGRDITDRKQAEISSLAAYEQLSASGEELQAQYEELAQVEQRIRTSEAKFRAIVDQSMEFIGLLTPDGTLIDANKTALEFAGISEEAVVNRPFWETPWWSHSADLQKTLKDAIVRAASGETVRFEATHPGADGQLAIIDFSIRPVKDPAGRIPYLIPEGRDITQQKKTEAALRQKTEDLDSRNRLISTLLDTVPIGIFMVEAPSGKPIIANREATRLLGRGILPDATEENLAEVYEAYRAGTTERYPAGEMPVIRGMYGESRHIDDLVVVRPDGTRVQLEIFGTPITDSQGRVVACLVCFLDITERKRAEQVIREANRKINLLTSITRHDVTNQVAILRGFTRIALMKKPDPVISDLLEKIDTAVSAIARQIEFTKAYQELGMQTPGWQRIRDIVAQQKTEGISLSCTCDAEVFADPMLERVFYNLIDNAVRHGETVTAITVSCRPDPDGLVIVVGDNGVGVPHTLKDTIFEKGYGKNTGFGLFLAREVLAITGIIIIETGTYRKGAQFEIIVPKGTYRIVS